MADLHSTAGGVKTVAVIVIAGYVREDRLEMRILRHSGLPLRDPEIGAAVHPDAAVRPRLPGDPVQRVVTIADFLVDRLESAAGTVASAHVLHNDRIAVIHERLVSRRDRVAFAV